MTDIAAYNEAASAAMAAQQQEQEEAKQSLGGCHVEDHWVVIHKWRVVLRTRPQSLDGHLWRRTTSPTVLGLQRTSAAPPDDIETTDADRSA